MIGAACENATNATNAADAVIAVTLFVFLFAVIGLLVWAAGR